MKASMISRAALLSVALASTVWASATYPAVIATEVGVDFVPQQCKLCHQNDQLVKAATITPFALSMKSRGLVIENDASLRTALAQNETDLVDSDSDGCTDIAELKAGEDPNVVSCGRDAGTGPLSPPRYGCGANVAPGLMAAISVFALMQLLRRRRA